MSANQSYHLHQRIGLVAGPALAALLIVLPAPDGLGEDGWRTAAVGGWMAVWWLTEALPIAATALLPLAVFPLTGVAGLDDTARPYANPLIFLFLGGFLIAQAMQRWQLHRRIALRTIRLTGTRPYGVLLGFMLASAFLSMWVSNTATAMMMMPIGLSVIQLLPEPSVEEARSANNLTIALMLAIAYGCSLGGMATLIGTPPNALLAGFFRDNYAVDVSFAAWLALALPIAIVGLGVVLGGLRLIYPIKLAELPGGRELVEGELAKLGRISAPERRVAAVFGLVALAWVLRPLLDNWLPGLTDPGIAMAAALALFLLPSGHRDGDAVLNWGWAERLPWGVLLLFGGGLSFASAVQKTGLAQWVGEVLEIAGGLPVLGLIAVVSATVVFLTELTSNTATTAAFLPVMAALAVSLDQPPLMLAAPAALAASCAFMLPVATPPNAIVYAGGTLTIPDMARAGIVLNITMIMVITVMAYALLGVAFSGQL